MAMNRDSLRITEVFTAEIPITEVLQIVFPIADILKVTAQRDGSHQAL
jgi:hypothetical protein